MLEELLLLSGNDILFFSANVVIHQPKIKEIAYIGEENFFVGCQLLNFSTEILNEEDRISLLGMDNFDILIAILNDEDATVQKLCATMVLSLLFPNYTVNFKQDGIYLESEDYSSVINKENYNEFLEIFKSVFELWPSEEEYRPVNEAAKRIADKLKKGREKVAQLQKKKDTKISVFSRYISILVIGLQMDVNSLLNHTVYQLYDEFKRFQLYQTFDINLRARMAGATDLEEVDNWMENIHS